MAFFTVTTDGILQPLGVYVTGDSRMEIMPAVREITEEIPGMDGEYDFGTELKPRILELHCVTDEGLSATEKRALERQIAYYLDPTQGTVDLVFEDEPDKAYMVKCNGNIIPENHATWFKFVIPFKMSDPYIISRTERMHTGAGVLINGGTKEVGVIIEMKGPLEVPQISLGGRILFYDGIIAAGTSLVIDTGLRTAKMGQHNALDRYNDEFPLLMPGDTAVSAGNTVTFKWTEKWI